MAAKCGDDPSMRLYASKLSHQLTSLTTDRPYILHCQQVLVVIVTRDDLYIDQQEHREKLGYIDHMT